MCDVPDVRLVSEDNDLLLAQEDLSTALLMHHTTVALIPSDEAWPPIQAARLLVRTFAGVVSFGGGVPRLALSFGEAGGEFGAAAGGVVGAEADEEEAAERVLEAQIG